MYVSFILSFFAGIVSVVLLEVLGLQALLEPLRDLIGLLVLGG